MGFGTIALTRLAFINSPATAVCGSACSSNPEAADLPPHFAHPNRK
jgi:hypothetical protein